MVVRWIALALLLVGCNVLGITRERAVEITAANAALSQVTVVSVDQEMHTSLDLGGSPRLAWKVVIDGMASGCVPGGGCRDRQARATYYIDAKTGEILDGVTELRG